MSELEQVLRAVVADDEPLARERMVALLAEVPCIRVVATCRNGMEAVQAIGQHRPDIAFLDIEMPKLDGFEVLELIDRNVAIVFVTAYDAYAVRAFEAEAIDYVMKPVSSERLAQAIERAKKRIVPSPSIDSYALRKQAKPDEPWLNRIAIKDKSELRILDTKDIAYLRAEDDYVTIVAAGKEYLKHQTLTSLEKALDPHCFVRIHRSWMVNALRVARIEADTKERALVHLDDGAILVATKSGEKRLKEVLGLEKRTRKT
jgi:two-component system, LytTR family, response regulator